MRRGKGKLSTFNWMLVLLAGIFQITTFILDQIVIQYEEDFRKINFEILSKSESRSAYLKMNNRVNDFLLAFEKQSNFDESVQFHPLTELHHKSHSLFPLYPFL